MGIVIGFNNGQPSRPEDQGLTPDSSYTVQPGQTVEETHGGIASTYSADDDE
ncbi:hypothetical protein [Streptomyces sp. NPDC020480]|uniref:hypothetical protein n=1 Tax=Streptomyces sp. NPDC020480 TaxID=3365076 RepID=UPI0037B2CCB8